MTSKWVAMASTAMLTPLVLSACYGLPPCDTVVDDDGDGYFTCFGGRFVDGQEDCDDTNEAINPGATEICGDGIDNDCDIAVDDNDRDCDSDSDSDFDSGSGS